MVDVRVPANLGTAVIDGLAIETQGRKSTPSDTSSCRVVKIDSLILNIYEGMPRIKHKLTGREWVCTLCT